MKRTPQQEATDLVMSFNPGVDNVVELAAKLFDIIGPSGLIGEHIQRVKFPSTMELIEKKNKELEIARELGRAVSEHLSEHPAEPDRKLLKAMVMWNSRHNERESV